MARSATAARPAERIVNGVREGGSVWIDLLREGNSRMYRFNRLLLDEADRTQEENADLFGQFISAPTRIGDLTSALVTTLQEQGRRRGALTRKLVSDLGEAAVDARRLFTRTTDAGRETVAATADAGRHVASRAAREVSDRAEDAAASAQELAREVRPAGGRPRTRAKSARRTDRGGATRRKKSK
jgi:hypothetical protein